MAEKDILSNELLLQNGAAPEELALTDNAQLTVHYMNCLSKEIRSRFTSDMGFIVDFLNEGNFDTRKTQKIVHFDALCEMMFALTNDRRFISLIEQLPEKSRQGKEYTMCEYPDILEENGKAKGLKIGRAQGLKIGRTQGLKIGRTQGRKAGERRLADLLTKLYASGRDSDARLAVADEAFRLKLYKEFHISR
jgi:hypothetical protein